MTDAALPPPLPPCRVWDLDIGDCVLLLEGHAGPLTDIAITSGGPPGAVGLGRWAALAWVWARAVPDAWRARWVRPSWVRLLEASAAARSCQPAAPHLTATPQTARCC